MRVGKVIVADPDVKNFSFTVVDDEVYYRENSVMNRMELPAGRRFSSTVKNLCEIRTVYLNTATKKPLFY